MVKAESKTGLKSSVVNTQSVSEKEVEAKVALGDNKSLCKEEFVQPKGTNPKICLFCLLVLFITITVFIFVVFFKTRAEDDRRGVCTVLDTVDPLKQPLWRNVSWETREELLLLRKMFGNDNVVSLRPVYRKDLPEDYIAYWEVRLGGSSGDRYILISAGKQTGDRRFAEEGSLPCPTDQLLQQAQKVKHSCHKFYRLTPRGDMICEDLTIGRIVAATRDIKSDSRHLKWHELDTQVNKALPRIKREWKKLANKVLQSPEWNKFQKFPIVKPTDASIELPNNQDKDKNEDEDLQITEIGLQPGESAYIPVSAGFRYIKVRFTGLGKKRKHPRRRQSFKRWQKTLCSILCDICDSNDNTRVNKDSIWVSNKGEKYVRFSIHSDKDFVRRELEDQQVQFQFELQTGDADMVVINYGVVLRSSRVPREVGRMMGYSIPFMGLFPEYNQHKYKECDTGSAAVAWSMIFGYFDNLAHMYPKYGYSTKLFKSKETDVAPLNMTKSARSFIESIYDELKSSCTRNSEAMTSFSKMQRIEKWFRQHQGDKAYIYTSLNRKEKHLSPTEIAIELIKSGVPIIISKDSHFSHFSVVTQFVRGHLSHAHVKATIVFLGMILLCQNFSLTRVGWKK